MRVDRIVDLSVVLDQQTQVYPGDPRPTLSPATTIATHGYNLLSLEIGSQSGTHVDSPYHFHDDGDRLESCDLSLFTGPGVIVDVRGHNARERIGWEEIEPRGRELGSDRIAVLHTGWSDLHYGSSAYLDHPFLDGDACARMLELGVTTFVIDCISLDETAVDGPSPQFSCHHQIAAAGGIIAENIINLEAVDWPRPWLSLLPIRLGGDADGAPCRAVALRLTEEG
jgi:kynurenine formamidase